MAGRRPRKTREELLAEMNARQDERDGEPLDTLGRRVGARRGNGAPQGNVSNLVSGMYSRRAVEARIQSFITALLEDRNAPDYLRMPKFAHAVFRWAHHAAMASLCWDYMLDILESEGPGAVFGLQQGVLRNLSEIWKSHSDSAGRALKSLGLTPDSAARIQRDLGLAQSATAEALQRMGEAGAQITSRRLGIVRGPDAAEA